MLVKKCLEIHHNFSAQYLDIYLQILTHLEAFLIILGHFLSVLGNFHVKNRCIEPQEMIFLSQEKHHNFCE